MKMQINFWGKSVLVTGATEAIGRACAAAFLAHGARVAINGPDEASVAATIAALGGGDGLVAAAGDLSTREGCASVVGGAVDAFGHLDVLVNAAQAGEDRPFESVTPENWAEAIDGSFRAALLCTQQAAPHLKAVKGNVVNVTSIPGVMGGVAGTSARASAAGSIVNLTRMSALRLGVDGLRVNCLCAGELADSPRSVGAVPPMVGRFGDPDDMAGTVLFLASPYAGFMTGSIVVNDGGVSAGN